MAILKFGVIVTGIRGSIGGTTFSQNGSSAYAKAWAQGPQPKSSKQQAQCAALGSMGAYWKALTVAQRAAWDTYAALPAQALTNSLGLTYYASGWNWFVKNVRQQLSVTMSPTYTAPVGARPGKPTISTMAVSTPAGGNMWITFPAGEFTGAFIVFFARMWNSQAVYSGVFQLKLVFGKVQDTTTYKWIRADMAAVFGVPIIGQRACAEIHRQNTDGQRSKGWVMYANVTT